MASGCSGDETGNAKLRVSVSALTSVPNVDHIRVVADMSGQPQQSVDLTFDGTSWAGTMTHIPAGNSWVFTGTAYDASNAPLYTGHSLPVSIAAQQTVTVLLQLSPVNPPPVFGNHAPHIESIYISNDHPAGGENVDIVVGATDPDTGEQAALTYAWTGDAGGVFTAPSSSTTGWSAAADGHYGIQITVTDLHSAFDVVTFSLDVSTAVVDEGAADISITFNESPQVINMIASTGHLQPGVPITVTANATDDTSGLTYTWSDDCAGSFSPDPTIPSLSNQTQYTPGNTGATSCTVTVMVTDPDGLFNSGTLTITVGADPVPTAQVVTSIAAGTEHTCALVNGAVWCWGYNAFGQLGDGTTTNSTVPVLVRGLPSGVEAITAGWYHTCARAVGNVYCWGYGGNYRLGANGDPNGANPTPLLVPGLPGTAQAIAAGDEHTCALVSGSVYCWGGDGYGELGDNGDAQGFSALPVHAYVNGTATAIEAGAHHACALVAGGELCWGQGNTGQIGNNAADNISSPQAAVTSGVTAISAGRDHTCAVVDGGAKCWGADNFGQLGDVDASYYSQVPVNVFGLTSGVTEIGAGTLHSCALVNGGVQCWGDDDYGQLGDGGSGISSVPVGVNSLSVGVDQISVGHLHTCAIAGGHVRCWGYNGNGQLGDGTTTARAVPVAVVGL